MPEDDKISRASWLLLRKALEGGVVTTGQLREYVAQHVLDHPEWDMGELRTKRQWAAHDLELAFVQAEILERVALWTEQPDEPTGTYGWVSSSDLRMRAVAIKVEAEVLFGQDLE